MKTNKLVGWCIAWAITFSINMTAQQAERKSNTLEDKLEHRIERLKKELMLDDATSIKFEETYRNYINDLKTCSPKKELNQINDKKVRKTLSDQELDKMMIERLDNQIKIAQTRKKYYSKFKEFLSTKQIAKLYSSQNKGFKKHSKTSKLHNGKREKSVRLSE